MTFTYYKVYRTPFEDESYDINQREEIEFFRNITTTMSLGDSKNSFSFDAVNFNNRYLNPARFKPRDKITIYRAINSTIIDTSSDLLMEGVIKNAGQEIQSNTDLFKVNGYDFSESVMNAIIFVDPLDANQRVHEALQSAVDSIKLYNQSFAVEWDENNPITKTNGAPFPLVTERWYYRPMARILQRYSTNQFTGDVGYYWFVNKDNKLVWRPRQQTPDLTYNVLTDINTKSFKIGKDTQGIVNFVISRGGRAPDGTTITSRYQDFSSSSRHGIRFKFLTERNGLAVTQNSVDMSRLGGSSENGTLPSNIPGFSYPANSFQLPWLTEIGETVVNNDSDYVEKFKRYIRHLLRKYAKEYVDSVAYGKLNIDIEVDAGSKNWGLGDLIRVTAFNVTLDGTLASKELRVNQIRYGETVDIYSLTEDMGTI